MPKCGIIYALPYGSIKSPHELLDVFFAKYFPAHMQHEALQRIFNFRQLEDQHLPKAWGRFGSLLRARPGHDIPKNELLIFYNGLTDESRIYLDRCAGCVFRKRTVAEAEELMAKIAKNYDEWSGPEPPPLPTPKKTGVLFLNPEDMLEANYLGERYQS